MKYQTAKYADGTFTINCPYCGREIGLTEEELWKINTQMGGHCPCPVEECKQDIEFPNAGEATELKAPTPPATQEVAPVPASEPAPAAAAQESAPTPAPSPTAQEPVPAPAPPPQTNPVAKSTQPPFEAPPAPASEPTALQKSPAFEYAVDRREAKFDTGFHGSKGATLEREASSAQRISMKTILHSDCVMDKKDTFDETVSKFLTELDEECLMGVHPVQYTADGKKGADFGVMILYKIMSDED